MALLKTIGETEACHELQLAPLRNRRDDLTVKLNGNCTRARAGIKGYFAEDPTEYELSGGTRASERKKGGPRGNKTDKGHGAVK